jgi:hypothetical protein
MIHAAEQTHEGENDSALIYIVATPTTPGKVRYIKLLLQDFQNGVPPENFGNARMSVSSRATWAIPAC